MPPSKVNPPKIGDLIYMRSSLYIDHGEDDFVGGLCEVDHLKKQPGSNTYFVGVKERPGCSINWDVLSAEQEKLAKKYGTRRGYCDPDPVKHVNIAVGNKTISVCINDLRLVIASIPEETRHKLSPIMNIYRATKQDAQVLFNSNLFPLLMGISTRFDATIEEVLKRKNQVPQ